MSAASNGLSICASREFDPSSALASAAPENTGLSRHDGQLVVPSIQRHGDAFFDRRRQRRLANPHFQYLLPLRWLAPIVLGSQIAAITLIFTSRSDRKWESRIGSARSTFPGISSLQRSRRRSRAGGRVNSATDSRRQNEVNPFTFIYDRRSYILCHMSWYPCLSIQSC